MRAVRRALWLLLLPFFAAAANGEAESELEAGLARIQQERTRLEARLREREQDCLARFAVNDCQRQARREQREVLTTLREQELALKARLRHSGPVQQAPKHADLPSVPAEPRP